jgi:hypothetical protein
MSLPSRYDDSFPDDSNDDATSSVQMRRSLYLAPPPPPPHDEWLTPKRKKLQEESSLRPRSSSFAISSPSSTTAFSKQSSVLFNNNNSGSHSKFKSHRRFRIYCYNYLQRLRLQPRRRILRLLLLLIFSILFILLLISIGGLVFWIYHHLQCYRREHGIDWYEAPIHFVGDRTCPAPDYERVGGTSAITTPNICMTTLTDRQSASWYQRLIRCRDFDALAQLTLVNHQAYALKHGYYWKDSSHLLDASRPPAWSKIKAVQALLEASTSTSMPLCDWVLWLDADVLIMNSHIKLEDHLIPSDPQTMLVAGWDRKFTVNSGVWLIRNSAWSHKFLEQWWNLKEWVRRPGMSLSGDNAAFGHLVDQVMLSSEPTTTRVIQVPARCNLNSFGVFLTEAEHDQASTTTGLSAWTEQQDWYRSDKFYHKGDFIVHASGIDKKKEVLELMAKRAT